MSVPLRRLAAFGFAASCLTPVVALAEPVVRASATATATVGYERNPFLFDTPRDTGAASAQIDLRPTVTITDTRASGAITAFYNRAQYFSKYDGNDNAGIAGTAFYQLSPRWSVNTSAGFTTGVIGSNNGLALVQGAVSTIAPVTGATPATGTTPTGSTGVVTPPVNNVTPVTGIGVGGIVTDGSLGDLLLPGGDVGLVGLRQRRNSVNASVGINHMPSERSTWSATVFGERSTYPDSGRFAQNVTTYGGSLGYNRRVSESTTVGLRGSATVAEYESFGKSTFYSPQITYNRRLSQRLVFDLAVGVSFVNTSGLLQDERHSTQLNGSASLCRADELTSYCVTAGYTPGASGFVGVTTTTVVGASYTRRLSELSTVSLSGNYTRSDTNAELPTFDNRIGDQDFWSVQASYSRRLSRRFSGVATAQYRDASYGNFSPRSDLSGRLGISVAMGALQ